MSAFDDEFGLFGEGEDQAERKPTLGARKIASDEAIDDIEPEDEAPRRRNGAGPVTRGIARGTRPRPRQPARAPADPAAAQKRAGDLLEFLAKKLVAKPEAVAVESFPPEDGEQALIELTVDPEDLGKVIGRSGRVAQALRTIVRATAEGRISVDILDTDEFLDEETEQPGDEPQPEE